VSQALTSSNLVGHPKLKLIAGAVKPKPLPLKLDFYPRIIPFVRGLDTVDAPGVYSKSGCSSNVERQIPNLLVGGSSPSVRADREKES
jgi:hypothetical protein